MPLYVMSLFASSVFSIKLVSIVVNTASEEKMFGMILNIDTHSFLLLKSIMKAYNLITLNLVLVPNL